ncbi:unnamed protein product [Pseudo-nitzschia multistriata]|uniref:Uncharacterized protein n=1 Tax=Pseudo-nitzschia multistriata TaxID=183589 RepID=A0A448Z5X3_9STRA|nr:unnamed protein product [Pseudo-nitzschia multistriata]
MMFRLMFRLDKAVLTTLLLSWTMSYFLCGKDAAVLVEASTSFSMESMMENGSTTISQECLPWWQRQIDVAEVFLVCDHQSGDGEDGDDQYYYTNRASCRTGDLGKVALGFTVKNQLPYDSTLFVSIKTHYYGRSATIRNRTDVCSFSNLGYINADGAFYSSGSNNDDNGDADDGGEGGDGSGNPLCPIQAGMHYMLMESFTLQDSSASRTSNWQEFKPDLSVSFYLSSDESSPPIGCVLTGTRAKHALDQRRSRDGVIALIVSVFSFVIVFGLCLHNQKQRKKAVELLENNRVASMIRRYNYRKSNSGGSSTGLMMGSSNHVPRPPPGDGLFPGGPCGNHHANRQPAPHRDLPPPWR